MYETHWGLNASPFRHSQDTRFFFLSPTHDEALARLHFLVDEQRQMGVLTGSEGTGKTLLLKVFADQLRERGRVVCRMNLLGMDQRGFWWALAAALRVNPDASDDEFALWRNISDRLTENRFQNLRTVVLLDDVHLADRSLTTPILRLIKSHPDEVIVILASAADGLSRLSDLLPLCELRIHLDSWSLQDTREYLESGLKRAGRTEPVFEDAAIIRLQELTDGVPRYISQMAEMALLAGASQQLDRIDELTIESVFTELGVTDAGARETVLV